MAFEVCSGGAASEVGIPETPSSRNDTRLVYLSIYASNVTVDIDDRKVRDQI